MLMMVWNEMASTDVLAGMMGTHDEATRNFFAGTAVDCVVVSRSKTDGVLADTFVAGCYTHHQKTVICDAAFEEDEGLRRIVAFIGGLDITDGRYDSPEFPLFRTIKNIHQGDFLRLVQTTTLVCPILFFCKQLSLVVNKQGQRTIQLH